MSIGKSKKKALLIGINYDNNKDLSLCGPHRAVEELKKLLLEVYKYEEDDIVVMLDGKEHDNLEPTSVNMLREIKNLVHDAQPGDHFFFYYAGHSEQILNTDHTEEDDMDEVLVSCDQQIIIDNQLRKYLVDPLPVGSSLTAIFDSCHSATILDLEHFRCNRVYTPWKFNGTRRWSDPKRAGNVRRLALNLTLSSLRIYENRRVSVDTIETRRLSIDVLPESDSISIKRRSSSFRSTEVWFDAPESTQTSSSRTKSTSTEVYYDSLESLPVSQSSMMIVSRNGSSGSVSFSSADLPIPRCSSPVGYCSGFCDPEVEEKSQIVCISACKDFQLSWESDGSSMTTAMIEFLRDKPHPQLDQLMKHISHSIYNLTVERHDVFRELKKKCKESSADRANWQLVHETGVDIENFQDPQISSLKKLDMKGLFTL